ncbi:uncharacterized protein LOC142165969 [Nicotiana tabacum]|uniref:Uncharacterized protein LOC142165969 n=1 Tax=Nicotiana tabacum TaxID=4097 RepID=A0AC58S675_TOBAC
MDNSMSNINGKIWLFFDDAVVWELVMETEQQVTIKLYHQDIGLYIMFTFVYDKCSSLERMELRNNMYYLASDMELPWVVGGDFNVVLYEDEKIGGLTGSDHAPLFMSYGKKATNFIKTFKFLNVFTKHETFKEVVRQNLIADFIGDPYLMFKQSLKREDILKVKEMLFEEEPTVENGIKAGMIWFTEGDRNTTFFHNHVIGKRHNLQLKRIQKVDGVRVESQDDMAAAAIEFYQRQFTREADPPDFILLDNVPAMVTMEQNLELCRYPTLEEVKVVVFELSGRV